MIVWELLRQLAECNPNAVIHFKLNMTGDTIQELAEGGEWLENEPLSFDELYDDDTDVDINFSY